jgi:single-stranded DNA-binding protein
MSDYKGPKVNFEDEGRVFEIRSIKQMSNGQPKGHMVISLYEGKNQDGTYKKSTFLEVEAWGEDLCTEMYNLQKNDRVSVLGKLTSSHWVDKQTNLNRSKLYVKAASIKKVEPLTSR